jgi:hypothetical protein
VIHARAGAIEELQSAIKPMSAFDHTFLKSFE